MTSYQDNKNMAKYTTRHKWLTTVKTSNSNVAMRMVTIAMYPESGATFSICSGCVALL